MSLQVLQEIPQNKLSYIYNHGRWDRRYIQQRATGILHKVVDEDLTPCKEFMGTHPLVNTSANHIVLVIKDMLLRINLKIENARGQCYDGASAMAGTKSWVATQLKLLNGKCLSTHCYGTALNLAVGDVIRNLKDLKEMYSTTYEICKLVKKSSKRNTRLDQIRNSTKSESKGIQKLCPTMWICGQYVVMH